MQVGKLHQARNKAVPQPALAFHRLEHFRVCFIFRGGEKKKKVIVSWLVGFCLFLFGFGFKCNKSLVSPSPVRWACTEEKLHFVREYPSALGGVTAKSCRGGGRGRLGARNIEMLLLSFGAFTLSCGSRRGPTRAVGTAMKCTQEGHLPNALQAC